MTSTPNKLKTVREQWPGIDDLINMLAQPHLTHDEVADMIEEKTGVKVSRRSLNNWIHQRRELLGIST